MGVTAVTRLLEVLLDRIAVAVIATDMAGRITPWNARAVALYDWSRGHCQLTRSV